MGCGSSHNFKNTTYDVVVLPIFKRGKNKPMSLYYIYILDKFNPDCSKNMIGKYDTEHNTIEIEFNKEKCVYTQGRNHKDIWVYAFTK